MTSIKSKEEQFNAACVSGSSRKSWSTHGSSMALYNDPCLTLDDLREAANELEDLAPTALRVLGSAHPDVGGMEDTARRLREAVRAGETLLRAREEGGA
jgi:hypothetical protein